MAENQTITIPVRLDEKTFRRFARFDMLRLRRRWVRPLVFALILCAFAAVALVSRLPQSGMIAAVLLVVGLGLPIVYIGMFLSQVNVQAAQWQLGKGRTDYTVSLSDSGIRVVSDWKQEDTGLVPWEKAARAFDKAERERTLVYKSVAPKWGKAANYDLSVNATGATPEQLAAHIVRYLETVTREDLIHPTAALGRSA